MQKKATLSRVSERAVGFSAYTDVVKVLTTAATEEKVQFDKPNG